MQQQLFITGFTLDTLIVQEGKTTGQRDKITLIK